MAKKNSKIEQTEQKEQPKYILLTKTHLKFSDIDRC